MPVEGCKMYYQRIHDLPHGRYSSELYAQLQTIDLDDLSSNKDSANVLLGLLYLRCGGIDEAHDIVTPYSWSSPESFAAGPPVLHSPAHQDACYAHAMVHRREGQHVGEFGTGWNNSSYWFGTVGTHPIYSKVYDFANTQAQKNPILQQHIAAFGNAWNPRQFLKLCETAVAKMDKNLGDFCQDIIHEEWSLLFEYCNQR